MLFDNYQRNLYFGKYLLSNFNREPPLESVNFYLVKKAGTKREAGKYARQVS